MTPQRGLFPAMLALLLPAAVAAQGPKDNDYTREASKYVGLALARQDTAEQRQMYEQALQALSTGMAADAQNPKVWYLAGQAHAGLGHIAAADSAFDRALSLYPDYADEIEAERISAWLLGFDLGVAAMEAENYEAALAMFNATHDVYPMRPEALLNASNLYTALGQYDGALMALDSVIAIVAGPEFQKLEAEEQATWTSYGELAKGTLPEVLGMLGVEQYGNGEFVAAHETFTRAYEMNPYSRDYAFNIVQSLYAQATELEKQVAAAGEGGAPANVTTSLQEIYTALIPAVDEAEKSDPASASLTMIQARAHERLGALTNDAAHGQGTQAVLQRYEERGLDVDELLVEPLETGFRVQGSVINRKEAAAGSNVTVVFTLLGRDGSTIGEQQIPVTLAAKDQPAPFQAEVPMSGAVPFAGWKYRIDR